MNYVVPVTFKIDRKKHLTWDGHEFVVTKGSGTQESQRVFAIDDLECVYYTGHSALKASFIQFVMKENAGTPVMSRTQAATSDDAISIFITGPRDIQAFEAFFSGLQATHPHKIRIVDPGSDQSKAAREAKSQLAKDAAIRLKAEERERRAAERESANQAKREQLERRAAERESADQAKREQLERRAAERESADQAKRDELERRAAARLSADQVKKKEVKRIRSDARVAESVVPSNELDRRVEVQISKNSAFIWNGDMFELVGNEIGNEQTLSTYRIEDFKHVYFINGRLMTSIHFAKADMPVELSQKALWKQRDTVYSVNLGPNSLSRKDLHNLLLSLENSQSSIVHVLDTKDKRKAAKEASIRAVKARTGKPVDLPASVGIFLYENEVWNGLPWKPGSRGGSVKNARASYSVSGSHVNISDGSLGVGAFKFNANKTKDERVFAIEVSSDEFSFTVTANSGWGINDGAVARTVDNINQYSRKLQRKAGLTNPAPPKGRFSESKFEQTPNADVIDQLNSLVSLFDRGLLSADEFRAAKVRLLER